MSHEHARRHGRSLLRFFSRLLPVCKVGDELLVELHQAALLVHWHVHHVAKLGGELVPQSAGGLGSGRRVSRVGANARVGSGRRGSGARPKRAGASRPPTGGRAGCVNEKI